MREGELSTRSREIYVYTGWVHFPVSFLTLLSPARLLRHPLGNAIHILYVISLRQKGSSEMSLDEYVEVESE